MVTSRNKTGILGIMPYPLTAAYNGSKAALAQYSETLRLELEPLGIRVVTAVTGQVTTNLPVAPKLEESSIYKPLEPTLHERSKVHKGIKAKSPKHEFVKTTNNTATEKSMSPETYASALVKHVSGSSPKPWFWKGTNSTVTWIVSTFAPKTAFVSYRSL